MSYLWSSEALLLKGDLDGALARLQRARALDPLSMLARRNYAGTLWTAGRRDQAVAELREAITLDPSFPLTRQELARLLLALGQNDEALATARKAADLAPDNHGVLGMLGVCLARSGHADEARALLTRMENERNRPFISSLELARIAAGLGDRDRTLRYLERAVVAREGFLPFIGGDEEFSFLRTDPRFIAIVHRIGIGASRGAPVS